jgi:hypothetical protein
MLDLCIRVGVIQLRRLVERIEFNRGICKRINRNLEIVREIDIERYSVLLKRMKRMIRMIRNRTNLKMIN